MTAIVVRPFAGPRDSERWDAFVERAPDATFFHRVGWRRILERSFGHRTHYLFAEQGEEVVGVLPLAEVRSLLFGHALVSLPFCAVAGAVATDPAALTALHEAAEGLGQRLGAAHLELRNAHALQPSWPQQNLYASFRKALDPDVEKNMLAIPRKQRAMVRKGIKNGLTSRIEPGMDTFFALYADNVHRHGTPPLPKRYFEALQATFGEAVEVMTVCDASGNPVSGVLSFYFRDQVLPYYAGDFTAARDLAANDFKYWELMRRSCERGIRLFDFGRSKQGTGPYDFKKNWGFEPVPMAYEYRLYRRDRIPENNPLNPKYRALIALWRRLPIGVANALGPHLVRSLG